MLSDWNYNFILSLFPTSVVKMSERQLQSFCFPSEPKRVHLVPVLYYSVPCLEKWNILKVVFSYFFTFRCVQYCICGISERFSYFMYIFRGCTVFKSYSYKKKCLNRHFAYWYLHIIHFPHSDFHASHWSVSSRAIRPFSAHVDGEHFLLVCTVYLCWWGKMDDRNRSVHYVPFC